MDHYGVRQQPWRYLEMQNRAETAARVELPDFSQRGKPVAFFYLDGRTPHAVDNLVLLSKQFSLFGFMSNLKDDSVTAYLYQHGVVAFKHFLNMEQVMEVADVVVTNGGAGVVNNAIHACKPFILMPMHLEQSMIAHRLYLNKVALVMGAQADNTTKAKWISDFAGYVDTITERMRQQLTTVKQQRPYWQGNMLTEFIQS